MQFYVGKHIKTTNFRAGHLLDFRYFSEQYIFSENTLLIDFLPEEPGPSLYYLCLYGCISALFAHRTKHMNMNYEMLGNIGYIGYRNRIKE